MRSFGDVIGVNNTDVFYNIAEDLRVPFYRILNELSLEESKGNLKIKGMRVLLPMQH